MVMADPSDLGHGKKGVCRTAPATPGLLNTLNNRKLTLDNGKQTLDNAKPTLDNGKQT